MASMVLAIVLASACPAADGPGSARCGQGMLHIQTGQYSVKVFENVAWTMRDVDYAGRKLLVPIGWQQSVLRVNAPEGEDPWIGTGHGREEVESVQVIADGTAHDLREGLEVTGERFTVRKKSWLGPYHHTSDVTIGPDGFHEEFSYSVEKDTSQVKFLYVFMHCFTNDTETWIAGLPDGEEMRGTFKDDMSFSLKRDVRWVMLYAPSTEIGAVYAFPEVYASRNSEGNMLWNRDRDNKLYFQVAPSTTIGDSFSYSVRLRAFTAGEAEWEAVARGILESLLEE
ncbi:MAG: hypothetical protein JXR94_02275 [Candidatus Hydrogenedentes bacterium]|nr:hypothetical protein [Candidatus Hydrogenedentota bacterium]